MLTQGYVEQTPPMVSLFTQRWGFVAESVLGSQPSSAGWESASRGVWFPISVPTACVAKRMWWVNGSTVNASYNVEAGIYLDGGSKPGAKLITTGSVAQGTATQVQFADITDTTLTPGLYWLFMSCSTGSATFFRAGLLVNFDELFRFEQAGIGPGSAPASATPVESTTTPVYLFGFSTTTIT